MDAQSVQKRSCNWLPVLHRLGEVAQVQMVDEQDAFSKGTIIKYYPRQGFGLLENVRGEHISFSLAELDVVGPKDKKSLKRGLRVGYDVGWTSKGLHVSKLKIY
ncbi:MAG: hypothetical protein HY540_04335 [Deltaproteobacteria bacterium]|nr:hypothetical protein [Deltaproteobacteria bacterium]